MTDDELVEVVTKVIETERNAGRAWRNEEFARFAIPIVAAEMRRRCVTLLESHVPNLTDGRRTAMVFAVDEVLALPLPCQETVACPDCKGRGWHIGECHPQEECGTCLGSGRVPR